MSKKLRLTGRASQSSPRLYGVGMKLGQVVNLRDEDANVLLSMNDNGAAVFTEVAGDTVAQYDLTAKYPDPQNVVAQAGKLFTSTPGTELAAFSVGGTADLSDVVYDGSNRATSFKSGGVTYTIVYATGLITVTSPGQQKRFTLDGSGRITKVETFKI